MARPSAPPNLLTTTIEKAARWAATRSMFPATFGLACCAIEMMATGTAHYDLARFGMEVFRASPRQADIMVVAGRVSQKMAPVLRQVYDQMVEPKWVISMGVCASSGGMFNNYAIVQGVDQVVLAHLLVSAHGRLLTRPLRRPGGDLRYPHDGPSSSPCAAATPARPRRRDGGRCAADPSRARRGRPRTRR